MKKKIVLIGPVYPYKGGISHYTASMYRALKAVYDVKMVSFQFQYPKLLYKKEQKDFTNDSFKIEDTCYWIHTVNPLNWFISAHKIKKEQPDFIICQWWHPYFAPCYWFLAKLLHNYKWLFVCHNVFPHERFPMDKRLAKLVLKQGDRFIVQSKKDGQDLETILSNPICELTVHPNYNTFRFKDISKEQARGLLNIEEGEHILLFFGFVREYKGLKHLINALSMITDKLNNIRLLIVGDFASNKDSYIEMIENNNVKEYVEIYDGYIPDKEVEKFFSACDLVVLPYESATQSGVVQIAYAFQKPVIVTDVGGLPDVVSDGRTGYVVHPNDPEAIAAAVLRYFEEDKEAEFTQHVREEAYRFSWDRTVEAIGRLESYEG